MNTAAYNPTAAALLARCSELAYVRGSGLLAADATPLGLAHLRRFTEFSTDTQGFTAVCKSEDCGLRSEVPALIVCFRGSESAQDWLTNLTLKQTRWAGAQRVHAGFFAAHLAAWPLACRDLLALIAAHPESPIFITGHSLGGALALLAARDLVAARPGLAHRTTVITFGAPRVGNRDWARAYDRLLGERTFRIVNEGDPVTRVPLAARGFQHVGCEIFFTTFGKRLTNPPLWFKLFFAAADLVKSYARLRLALATDHCIGNYVRVLARDAEATK